MIKLIILSIIFVYLLGFMLLSGFYSRVNSIDRPMIYNSNFIMGLINLLTIIFYIYGICFAIFVSWKLALIYLIGGSLLGRYISMPLAEFTLIYPLYSFLYKKGKELEKPIDKN